MNTLDLLDSIFQCAMAGLHYYHRDAIEAVLDFFFYLFSWLLFSSLLCRVEAHLHLIFQKVQCSKEILKSG